LQRWAWSAFETTPPLPREWEGREARPRRCGDGTSALFKAPDAAKPPGAPKGAGRWAANSLGSASDAAGAGSQFAAQARGAGQARRTRGNERSGAELAKTSVIYGSGESGGRERDALSPRRAASRCSDRTLFAGRRGCQPAAKRAAQRGRPRPTKRGLQSGTSRMRERNRSWTGEIAKTKRTQARKGGVLAGMYLGAL
jgi:hypothetical protein